EGRHSTLIGRIKYGRGVVRHQASMDVILSTLLNDIHHSADGTAVFRLKSTRFDLHFLNKLENNVLLDTPVLDLRSVQPLDQIRVFRVARPVDLKAVVSSGVLP